MSHYADDTTIIACHPDLDKIVKQLKEDLSVIVKLFSDYFLKLNDDKCHLMKLNRVHERALRPVRKDRETEPEELKKKYVIIQQHNLQLLLIERCKTKNNRNPAL